METSTYKEKVWEQIKTPLKKSWRGFLKQLFSNPANRCHIDNLRKQDDLIAAYQFGVYSGKSIVEIVNNIQDIEVVYGFDSFVGLPENTDKEREISVAKSNFYQWKSGDFNASNLYQTNDVRSFLSEIFRENLDTPVHLVEGWFSETLNKGTIKEYDLKPASYIDIDVDTYSSCCEVLDFVFDNKIAVSGTVIGFDDWGGTVNWKTFGDGVSKAFVDSLKKHGVELDFVVQVGATYPYVHRLYLMR
jgi:hypothetical protein